MKNIGNTDRIIRVIIGLGLLSLLMVLNGNMKQNSFAFEDRNMGKLQK